VTDGTSGVGAVNITLTDSGNILQAQVSTASDGTYCFEEVEPGFYTVTMIVPIGYVADSFSEVDDVIVNSNDETAVDFVLQRLVSEVDTRSMGFWKHQVKANLTGKGNAHESQNSLLEYLNEVHASYDILDEVEGLEGMETVLDPPKPPTMRERAEQQLMTLLPNLTSFRIATYTDVSLDDTCGEAIEFILALLDNPASAKGELEFAKDVAADINDGLIPVDPERIPEQ
jgi:hypothetical protein